MPRRRISIAPRDNAPAQPIEVPKSLQKKAKPVKDMDSVIAQAKAMSSLGKEAVGFASETIGFHVMNLDKKH